MKIIQHDYGSTHSNQKKKREKRRYVVVWSGMEKNGQCNQCIDTEIIFEFKPHTRARLIFPIVLTYNFIDFLCPASQNTATHTHTHTLRKAIKSQPI